MEDKATAFFIGSLVAFIALGSVLSLYRISAVATTGSTSWGTYTSETIGFSVAYPHDYVVNDKYSYEIAPGRTVEGVSFIIPPEFSSGTNLGDDTYISIETIPQFSSCHVAQYLYSTPTQDLVFVDEGLEYSVGQEVGAAAGNRYEETLFVRKDEGPCLAIRYFIHSTNIENYDAGAVQEFDKQALVNEFDQIRRSLEREI